MHPFVAAGWSRWRWLALAGLGYSRLASAEECSEPFTPTYEVQGVGHESPLLGETVTVAGSVTADFRDLPGEPRALGGVFIQDPRGDGDSGSSDGLFLYFGSADGLADGTKFAPGTGLRATGVVTEYDGETQLNVEFVMVCQPGTKLAPTELDLPARSARQTDTGWVAEFEAFEGMLLATGGPLRVADLGAYTRHGELTLVHGMVPWWFTHENPPSVDAFLDYERAIAQRTLVLDDGSNGLYPDSDPHRLGLRIGAAWQEPSGFLLRSPRFDAEGSQAAYRIVAATPALWTAPTDEVQSAATPSADSLRVVAVNLHNLFKDGGDGAACYPSFSADDCRGATDAAARRAHLRDSARHAAEWGADIIAASEVQNDFGADGERTWDMWVQELNAACAAVESRCKAYAPIIPADYHGGDAIAVALAYCVDTLTLDTFAAPEPELVKSWGPGVFSGPNSSRLPLLGAFSSLADGRSLTVVVNHFKSRSPGSLPEQCPNSRLPDCDRGDGQGYFNSARSKAAQAVSDWLRELSYVHDEPILVVGDLNSYAKEGPLTILQQNGYALLTDAAWLTQPSYAYNARLGILDHLLISRAHVASVARVGVLAGNVGLALGNGASSDHDPVFVDLNTSSPPSACDCSAATLVGTHGDDVLWGTEESDVICAFGGNDVVFGFGGSDCIDAGLGNDWVFVPDAADSRRIEGEQVFLDSADATGCDP